MFWNSKDEKESIERRYISSSICKISTLDKLKYHLLLRPDYLLIFYVKDYDARRYINQKVEVEVRMITNIKRNKVHFLFKCSHCVIHYFIIIGWNRNNWIFVKAWWSTQGMLPSPPSYLSTWIKMLFSRELDLAVLVLISLDCRISIFYQDMRQFVFSNELAGCCWRIWPWIDHLQCWNRYSWWRSSGSVEGKLLILLHQ